jgi:signal peptidase I
MHQDLTIPSPIQASPSRWIGPRKFGAELLQTIVLMSVLFLAVRGVVQNFRVEGPSMQPTLTTGEFLWVNKAAYFEWNGQYILGGPQRGDIAVLRPPDTTEDIDLIKRVIGLPGDQVRVQHGQVFINGRPLDEPYITFQASYNYPPDGHDATVPAGQYFVLGDNRANSRDSHMGWFVPAENLVGRAWLSYWPPAAWGIMPGVAYANS